MDTDVDAELKMRDDAVADAGQALARRFIAVVREMS
jgi:hypothetical protein